MHPMARDEFENVVDGERLPTTIGQFKQHAVVIIQEEQAKANPDTRLIGFACDAVRLAREWGNAHHTTLDAMRGTPVHEVVKLVEYFRVDGYSRFAYDGDLRGLSPAECAIKAMREYDRLLKTPAGSEALSKMLHQDLIDKGLIPS